MKQSFHTLVALALLTLVLNAASFAQDFGHEVRANIPFSFYAGDKAMPAGNYTFAINQQNHNIAIYQSDRAIGAFLLGSPHDGSNNERTVLTFRANDEDVYVLQKLQGPDFGISFSGGKSLSHTAEDRPANATQTVLAQLVK